MAKKSLSVTIRDVAREADVSVATISRYINQSAPVSGDVAVRIERAINKLNYVPQAAARQLATQKTRIIGLLLTDMRSDFFAPLLSGIETVVKKEEYNLLVATHLATSDLKMQPPIGMHNADGMIVFANSLADKDLIYLHQNGFPMISIYRSAPDGYDIPSVTVENVNSTRRIIEHLITVHHKTKIVFVRGPENNEDSKWREQGYLQALEAHGIPLNPELIISGEFEREISYKEMKNFLKNGHEFDAVFSGGDDSAIGIVKALREANFQLPRDISIAGFDDLRISAFLTPPLTTVKAPTEMVGRTAARFLFDLISGYEVDLVTVLPTEIVIRRSCGCFA